MRDSAHYLALKSFVLYLYACAVTRQGAEMLAQAEKNLAYVTPEMPTQPSITLHIGVEVFARGGKLRRSDGKEEGKHTGARAGSDDYIAEERSIQGFIRKVGPSRTPSREAVERAEALGFSLASDETYVQPFIRSSWRLRRKED